MLWEYSLELFLSHQRTIEMKYDHKFFVFSNCPSAVSLLYKIILCLYLQHPVLHIMSAHEKNFSVEVEKLLNNISSPHYRQLIVEVSPSFS